MTTTHDTDAVVLDDVKGEVLGALATIEPRIQQISQDVHAHPELGFEEHRASDLLCAALTEEGFEVTRGIGGLPTAFRASYRGGEGPTVAFLAEYDALPEIGHGCGHNLICSSSVAAAVALKRAWADLPGEVVVMGTPAEEGGGGKIILLREGCFDGVDVSMMFHPGIATVINNASTAATTLHLEFSGRSTHAAVSPWDGVNAADAAMLFFAGVNAFRQHVRPDARLHGYIKEAGVKPNMIPAHASVDFMVRANRAEDMVAMVARVVEIGRAAAMMTGAEVEIVQDPAYLEYRHCASLGELALRVLVDDLGEDAPPPSGGMVGASGDAGNVSHHLPHLPFQLPISATPIPGHSEEWRDAAISEKGAEAGRLAAKILAVSAIELFSDPARLDQVRAEHEAVMAPAGR